MLRGHRKALTSASFSPDGRLVVTTSIDHDGRTWDVKTGDVLRVLRGHFALVTDASFSPDGHWIATAGPTTAGLWDTRSGRLLIYLRGHRRLLTSVSFDAAGKHILTSSRDGSVRIYSCEICAPLEDLLALADARLSLIDRKPTPTERAQLLLE